MVARLLATLWTGLAGAGEPITPDPIGATTPGLTVWAYDLGEDLPRRPVVPAQTPTAYFITPSVDLSHAIESPYGDLADMFAGRAWGWLRVTEPGLYLFRLTCDDGAALEIDGRTVADTEHGPGFDAVGRAELDAGLRRIEIPFYENKGHFTLRLDWRPPGADGWTPVPAGALVTEAGQTFVTAPGKKRHRIGPDPRPPGDGRPLEDVHPAFALDNFRGPDFRPPVGGMAFMPDGRLAVCTWDRDGAVYLLDDLHGPGPATVSRFASGLGEPLGIAWHEGALYVAQKQEVTRLVDEDGDGVADLYDAVASGWPASHNYHEFTFNLAVLDRRLYVSTSVPLRSGWTSYLPGSHGAYSVPDGPGSVFEIDPETGSWSAVATGLRTPNGMSVGLDGALFGADNQGSWLPASRLNHITPGGFYGHQTTPDGDRPADPPVVWFPQDEIGNSPSQPALVPDGPYRGHMLVGDVTHGGIKRVFAERVGPGYQGCVFRFSQGLEAGVNRLVFGPDGNLYAGGIGSNGNWHHKHKKFGLQRLVPGGTTPFEILRVESRADGFLLTLTAPAPESVLTDRARYDLVQWRYHATEGYGGPKLDTEPLAVDRAVASPDRTQVFIRVPGLRAGRVVYLRLRDFRDDDGRAPWTTEAWYTLNTLGDVPGPAFAPEVRDETSGLMRDPPEGAVVLFDGRDTSRLRPRSGDGPIAWTVEHGTLVVDQGAGDVVSREHFRDFLLHVEWLSPPGGSPAGQRNGNSGIKIQNRYELQIMNTAGAPRPALFNEAGSIYRFKPADRNVSAGAGCWQRYDVFFTAARWDDAGNKVANARMTVYWNGVLVHDDVEVTRKTGLSDDETPEPGPVLLQAHESGAVGDVRFRNIWVLPDPGRRGIRPPTD